MAKAPHTPITEVALGWYANLNPEFLKQFRGSLSKSEPIAIEAKNILDKVATAGSVSDTELFKVCFILLLFGTSTELDMQAPEIILDPNERKPKDS